MATLLDLQQAIYDLRVWSSPATYLYAAEAAFDAIEAAPEETDAAVSYAPCATPPTLPVRVAPVPPRAFAQPSSV